jgi:hypothetical protein
MKSPKEKVREIKDDVGVYMNKYVCAVYKFIFGITYRYDEEDKYLVCKLNIDSLDAMQNNPNIPIIKLSLNDNGFVTDNYSSYLDWDDIFFVLLNGDVKSILNKAKSKCDCSKYEQIFTYFNKKENIKNLCEYVLQQHELLYCTPYIYHLQSSYTFLLCNKKNKIFPKEISKLIINKLLFFWWEKKNEKGKRLC